MENLCVESGGWSKTCSIPRNGDSETPRKPFECSYTSSIRNRAEEIPNSPLPIDQPPVSADNGKADSDRTNLCYMR